MSLDHVGIPIPFDDFPRAKEFYTTTLKTLGYKLKIDIYKESEGVAVAGYGAMQPQFFIGASKQKESAKTYDASYRSGFHVAFAAKSRSAVDRWYEEVMRLGAQDNGKPGLRPQYHPFYYGAFVIDKYGNNIEAVNHFDVSVFLPWQVVVPIVIAVVSAISYHYYLN